MSEPIFPPPTTENLCGTFADPTTRDPGLATSAPIKPTCEAPVVQYDGLSTVSFVDGQPVFSPI